MVALPGRFASYLSICIFAGLFVAPNICLTSLLCFLLQLDIFSRNDPVHENEPRMRKEPRLNLHLGKPDPPSVTHYRLC